MKTKLFLFVSIIGASLTSYAQENEIPDAGNVGIGTTDPTEKLDVRGGARIDSTLKVGDSLVITNGARVGDDLRVSGDAYIDGGLRVSGSSNLSQTTIGGVLTLSSLTPSTTVGDLLTVDDQGNVKSLHGIDVGMATYHQFLVCDPTNDSPTWKNGLHKIYTPCPEVYVGIATATPLYHLDVRGTGYLESGLRVGNVQTSSFTTPSLIEGERLASINAPLMRLSIKNTSGTTETKFKIEKDGTVYCTEVRIRPTAAIPDYVFKPNYYLMPLNELRTYVNTNNHLPNVPSENEILEQGGTDVNEMQMRLLEKVEELTLYILELDQQNAELQKRMEELQQQIKQQ